jgi:hypothetical protein
MKSEPEQLAMFKRIADGDFRPNENGLFDVAQVAHLVTKRGCKVADAGDYSCTIGCANNKTKGQLRTATIMATDKGLWHPAAIFRACREAAGQPHYEIDYATAKIKIPGGGLNEVLIAQIVGADGVRQYLSRPSKYVINQIDGSFRKPSQPKIEHLLAMWGLDRAAAGSWTWPMFCIMAGGADRGKSYDYRRTARALNDAGLLKLTVGHRGGFGTATFQWLPAAYLAVSAPKLDHADSEFLTDLMAVSG